jgi:hypothetical protein
MIKPAYSVSFLLLINIFVWQNVLYFPNDPRRRGRVGYPARPRPTALLSLGSAGKPEAAAVVVELLMMGVRTPETC